MTPTMDQGARAARLDRAIDQALAEQRIVGTVVLVAEAGEIVYRRAGGLADREAGRLMAEDQLFRLSSVTKPFTTVAALALVERGQLALDVPVTRYLPGFRPALRNGVRPVITPRHLLTHTAGLSYGFLQPPGNGYQRAGVSDGIDHVPWSLDENLRRIAAVPLAYTPGASWGYSVATDVLGAVLEQAAGAPLAQVITDLVTAPLGLTDCGFTVADPARLAVAYADGPAGPVVMTPAHELVLDTGGPPCAPLRYGPGRALDPSAFPSGGAGMVGSAPAVLALLEALRQGGGPLLSPASVTALLTDSLSPRQRRLMGAGWSWGLGFPLLLDPQAAQTPQAAGSWSWGGVYGHNWFVDPAGQFTVVILTNTAIAGMTGAFPTAIRDAVYG